MKIFALKSVTLLCYIAFFLQFASLTKNYLGFRTTTQVTYHSVDAIAVPAATLCFHALVPNHELHLKVFRNESSYSEKSYKKNSNWLITELGKHCTQLGDEYSEPKSQRRGREFPTAQIGCLLRYYGNLTVKEYLDRDVFGKEIWCMESMIRNCKGTEEICPSRCRKKSTYCNEIGFVYSLGFRAGPCVRLYVKDTECLQMYKIGRYVIQFHHDRIEQFFRFRLGLNEAKATPSDRGMAPLESNYNYRLTYSRVVLKRLEPPFDSDCHRYHDGREKGAVSRSDCIARCFVASLSRNDSLGFYSHFFNYPHFVLHKGLFPKKARMSDFVTKEFPGYSNYFFNIFPLLELECEKICQPDCEETLYFFKVSRDSDVYMGRHTVITVEHDVAADLLYEHFEEMDLFEYLSIVGVVAGMWVGVSLVSIADYLLGLIFNFVFRKLKSCLVSYLNQDSESQWSLRRNT